jgi:Tfp pilus assembly protein PilX
MILNMHVNVIESASRRFDQNAGYALAFVVAVLLLIGILINPTLP